MFSEISFIRIEFCDSLKRMTPDTVPSTLRSTLQHWSQNLLLLSLCLLTVSRSMRSFDKSKSPRETCKTEISPHIVVILVNPVLSCVTLEEIRDVIEVWIVDERRVTVYRSGLVELFGLITCVEDGFRHVARFNGTRAEMRMSFAFRTGTLGKDCADGKGEGDSSYGNSKDGWDMRQRRRDGDKRHTHTTNLFRHLSHACMCTRMKMCSCDCARAMCRKMCVQQVSVCTPWGPCSLAIQIFLLHVE